MTEPAILAYDRNQHENILIHWWSTLDDEEKSRTFHSTVHRLGNFLEYFNRQVALLFALDSKGLWIALWTQPYYDGVELGFWLRPDRRQQWRNAGEVMCNLETMYGLVFEKYPIVVGFTHQEALHKIHLKLGYQYAGRVPGLSDGKTLYAYWMNREMWLTRAATARNLRIEDHKRKIHLVNGAVV